MKIEKELVRLLYVPTHLVANAFRWVSKVLTGRGRFIRVIRDEEELQFCKEAALLNIKRYNELAPRFGVKTLTVYEDSGTSSHTVSS